MQIVLTAVQDELADAFERACGELPYVEVRRCSIFEVGADALVSPANSFGFMDGGIDMAYSRRFGWELQARLQSRIRAHYDGELLVGQAAIVPTEGTPRYLIAAPTMRVPTILGPETVAPYLAARAALRTVKSGVVHGSPVSELVHRVAFPGLGTGVGQVPAMTCARQIRAAIDHVIEDDFEFPTSWHDAQERHQRLYGDAVRDLQYPEAAEPETP